MSGKTWKGFALEILDENYWTTNTPLRGGCDSIFNQLKAAIRDPETILAAGGKKHVFDNTFILISDIIKFVTSTFIFNGKEASSKSKEMCPSKKLQIPVLERKWQKKLYHGS